MLYIDWVDRDGNNHQKRWWVGYPMPTIRGRVVKFQADGDELDVLVKAIQDRSMKGT